jgi:two-component system, OmpR family, response regulator
VASFGYGVDWMKRLDEGRQSLATVPYDLVLLDLNLPDGRGLDLLRELRRGGSKVPVIILTRSPRASRASTAGPMTIWSSPSI